MNIPVINTVAGLFRDIFGLVDQVVEDKDKKNELIFKLSEMKVQFDTTLLQTTTTPKVDAFVKIMFMVRDVILPILRPVGSAFMSGFAAYCRVKGVPLDPAMEAVFAAAFPGWMYSRHVDKKEKNKTNG